MSYLLGLPPMDTRHKVEEIKGHPNAIRNPKNPLHNAVKEENGYSLEMKKSWMGKAEWSILAELKQMTYRLSLCCQTHTAVNG